MEARQKAESSSLIPYAMLYREFETQEELDEQYDVESAVDDFVNFRT